MTHIAKRPYIYVASSWRCRRHPIVVKALRGCADVYNFREPVPGGSGFSWSEIDPEWKEWDAHRYIAALDHPVAVEGFRADENALRACDACVLVLPCGRSAHLEAGVVVGSCKPLAILLDPEERIEPELMYAMADVVTDDLTVLANWAMRLRGDR